MSERAHDHLTGEWQPARLRRFHGQNSPERGKYRNDKEFKEIEATIVMARPYSRLGSLEYLRMECDCPDGKSFYDVIVPSGRMAIVCEHEILTD